jgi:acyl-CoA thioesterase-1
MRSAISGAMRPRFARACLLVLALSAMAASARPIEIVSFGTSFTAGKGVSQDEAYPARLEQLLKTAGKDVEVTNRGRNGDTTENLLDRLDSAVPAGTDICIFEYAMGNDRRRNIPPEETRKNVEEVISRLAARHVATLLVIRAHHRQLLDKLVSWFGDSIKTNGISYIAIEQPESSLQADGQHPTAQSHEEIAASMVPYVTAFIDKANARP